MNIRLPLVAMTAICTVPLAHGAIVIDNFISIQVVSTNPLISPVSPSPSLAPAPSSVGGTRQMIVSSNSTANTGLTASSGADVFNYDSGTTISGTAELFYGGATTTATTRNYNGLASFDLGVVNPASSAFFLTDFDSDAGGVTIEIRIYPFTGAATSTEPVNYIHTTVAIPNGLTGLVVTEPVQSFLAEGSGVDLSNIGSILVSITSDRNGADMAMGSLTFANFSEIPEPGMAGIAFAACGGMVLLVRRRKLGGRRPSRLSPGRRGRSTSLFKV